METLTTAEMDEVEETKKLLPMIVCGSFASAIMGIADKLINRNLIQGWEMNCELMSKELCSHVSSAFSKIESFHGYSPENITYCCDPKIEGGDSYNVYLEKNCEWKDFGFDVFKYSVGVKLDDYCCYLIRSTGFRCTKQVEENYAFMMSVYEEVLEKLQDGIELCEVYKAVQSFAEKENSDLVKHLEKQFGFQLGPNFNEDSTAINSTTQIIAKKDMFFAVKINLIGLKEGDMEYSLCHCDTVVVRKDQPARVLTYFEASSTDFTQSNNTENGVNSELTKMTIADEQTSDENGVNSELTEMTVADEQTSDENGKHAAT